jgi:hypothetical protein
VSEGGREEILFRDAIFADTSPKKKPKSGLKAFKMFMYNSRIAGALKISIEYI